MIDHLSTYARDFLRTRSFYLAVFAELGYSIQFETALENDAELPGRRICAFGPASKTVFWVIEATEKVTPRHVAFTAGNREAVQAFHAAGLSAGGQDHGAAGLRPIYHEHYYGAFLLDPDGNNVEAVCHSA